ncbi:MAG: hypothetical protein A2534_00485 [Candidatus Magasanikbacteria bacterium RIFOXYD2_FULL_39_9]|uniref:Uncharacterized protein n=1 Tax=Candidatus Magasanikbacteria bacterium RIFOXYD1_FULL_40_23 TaxID=1798705 RepID=A0A1F6PAT9_9BACT|nr:MAG: hypothetical protein A2534_00485 [Candidatus Magasanikbacteria bacterium RIFOXYD2_FULL_39_9]OGH93054.1 MAG: hypothetical protein A2563_04730 [Candidatus Magasanikbacteria bacterium RIFOXYD1_FULL_40_23]
MRRFAKLFISLVVVAGAMVPFFVFADSFGLRDAAPSGLIGSGSSVSANKALPELIGSVVGAVLSFVGIIFFLLILYAGIMWMTAFGNEQKVEKAKDIVQHAAIGLVIVLAAYAISKFVFGALAGATTGGSSSTTIGCCFNSRTNRRVSTLEANCVPDENDPRTWTAGACPPPVLGCCYTTSAPVVCDQNVEESTCTTTGVAWQAGSCPATCL